MINITIYLILLQKSEIFVENFTFLLFKKSLARYFKVCYDNNIEIFR